MQRHVGADERRRVAVAETEEKQVDRDQRGVGLRIRVITRGDREQQSANEDEGTRKPDALTPRPDPLDCNRCSDRCQQERQGCELRARALRVLRGKGVARIELEEQRGQAGEGPRAPRQAENGEAAFACGWVAPCGHERCPRERSWPA